MLQTFVPEACHDQRRRGGADVYEFLYRVALFNPDNLDITLGDRQPAGEDKLGELAAGFTVLFGLAEMASLKITKR